MTVLHTSHMVRSSDLAACGSIIVCAAVAASFFSPLLILLTVAALACVASYRTAHNWRYLLAATALTLTASETGILYWGVSQAVPFAVAAALLAYSVRELRSGDWVRMPRRQRYFLTAVVMFLIFGAASVLWSVDASATVQQITAAAAVIGTPLTASVRRWRNIGTLETDLRVLYWVIVVAVVLGYMKTPAGFAPGVRLGGLFENPNSTASVAALAFGMGIGLSGVKSVGARIVYFLAQSTLVVAAIVTQSRTGILAMVLALLWSIIRRTGGRLLQLTVVLVVVALAAAVLTEYDVPIAIEAAEVVRRFTPSVDAEFSYLSSREQVWATAADIWTEAPAIGHGYRAVDGLFEVRRGVDLLPYNTTTAHNGALQVLVESGVIGLALISTALFMAITSRPPSDVRARRLWVGVSGAVVAGLSTQVTRSSLLGVGSVFALLFWVVICALVVLSNDGHNWRRDRLVGVGDHGRFDTCADRATG